MRFPGFNEAELRNQLAELQAEHRDLDHALEVIQDNFYADQLRIKRMKKRKLALKDLITAMQDVLIPDEPA
jgi:hypothetical protein